MSSYVGRDGHIMNTQGFDNKDEAYGRTGAPLRAYAFLTFLFIIIAIGFFWLTFRLGIDPSKRISLLDMLILGIAVHKISWLITKDVVTSFIRAPFVKFIGWSTPGASVNETARGSGLKRAIGEFMTCPWCAGQWVALFVVISFIFWPTVTVTLAIIFNVLMLSDFLQIIYAILAIRMQSNSHHHN